MSYRIALIPGDGIGKEVVPAARQVLDAISDAMELAFEFVPLRAGWGTFEQSGSALPPKTLDTLNTCDGALFGAVSSPSQRVEGYSSPIIAIRKALNLYANVRPIVSPLSVESDLNLVGGYKNDQLARSQMGVDMLIVRENTEGLYVKQERLLDDGETAIADRVITRSASERIARFAFEQAAKRAASRRDGASLVTIVHKSNVLSVTDGLFRETALAVADEFPDVETEEQLVDSMVYRMILEPQRYDVIVAPNLYGDILSDAAAALVGGLGLIPSANVGADFVLAEPVHGSAPDIAGQGKANPIATIRAAGLLLAALGESTAAANIQDAVQHVLQHGPWTADLSGEASTDQVADAVIERLV